jgi:integrase
VQLGRDPYVEKDTARADAELTLGAIADRFLDFQQSRLKVRSLLEVKRHLLRDWQPFARLPIKHISRAQIAAQIGMIARERGGVTANHARTSLSGMFTWAMKQGLVESNPVIATHRAADVVSRDRVLSDVELVAIWIACREDDYGRIVRLLILTGQRRAEVGGMTDAELDFAARRWAIPWERTKNGRRTRAPHEIPLSDPALDILREAPHRQGRAYLFGDGDGSFSGWSKAKTALDARLASVGPWRIHDIRRTVATRVADLGVAPHVIEAVLNNISGHKAGVAGVYNRATYLPERRQALDLWGAHVATLVAGKACNVVTMGAPA